ncbi:MAG: translesion error-prone DNA polymerase V autoproteolytic subunit [Simkaniaceae bacterium]|nr:translesion error-prone DNA polymerase V autoproteolytic subunit [Simkaniaceae bacterium]
MRELKITLFTPEQKESHEIPLVTATVKAGFPSPAEDFVEKRLDLNELIVQHPAATFFVRVEGHSMEGAGILDQDILVVDRSLEVKSGAIVVARLGSEFTVKRIQKSQGGIYLSADNPDYADIPIDSESEFEVWGVVSYIIHKAT